MPSHPFRLQLLICHCDGLETLAGSGIRREAKPFAEVCLHALPGRRLCYVYMLHRFSLVHLRACGNGEEGLGTRICRPTVCQYAVRSYKARSRQDGRVTHEECPQPTPLHVAEPPAVGSSGGPQRNDRIPVSVQTAMVSDHMGREGPGGLDDRLLCWTRSGRARIQDPTDQRTDGCQHLCQ